MKLLVVNAFEEIGFGEMPYRHNYNKNNNPYYMKFLENKSSLNKRR